MNTHTHTHADTYADIFLVRYLDAHGHDITAHQLLAVANFPLGLFVVIDWRRKILHSFYTILFI